jgi:hypothetical protein
LLLFVPSVFADENDIHQDLKYESLGSVHIDDRLEQVLSRIGKVSTISKPMMDPKNKCEKRVYYFPNDLEVEICTTPSKQVVHSVRSVNNDKVQTLKGAKTGMTFGKIKQLYPKATAIQDHTLIVKDTVTNIRLRFLLSDGKVYEISLYREKKVKESKVRSTRSKLMDF